jgi:hypothetical protein
LWFGVLFRIKGIKRFPIKLPRGGSDVLGNACTVAVSIFQGLLDWRSL